jgi:virulence-associated protein VapD
MANIEHTDFNPDKLIELESLPVIIVRKYKNITVSLECSGFTDGYGEIYYNAKDVEKIEKIIDTIKEDF